MRIHYLQHVPFEDLGYIEHWAQSNSHTITRTAFYAEESPPGIFNFDFLVIMGGPMGVHDTDQYPWLPEEKNFIKQCVLSGKKVLGICLGAQLIAASLGANVFPNPYKEIGWHSVNRLKNLEMPEFSGMFPDSFLAFHWHGDTFELPTGAIHLAQSEACVHQAFYCPPAALGLQFHLESTAQSIASLIEHCGHELVPSPYIQSSQDMGSKPEFIASSNAIMRDVLDFMVTL
jgi:GMP synthase-like glutamine amidotransferase